MLEQQLSALRNRMYADNHGDIAEILNEFIGKCRAPQMFDGEAIFNGPTTFNDPIRSNAPVEFIKPVEFNKEGSAYTPATFNRPVVFNDTVDADDSALVTTSFARKFLPVLADLTTDVSGGSASCKFVEWVSGSYAQVGSAFTVYDPAKLAGMAFSGQRLMIVRDWSRSGVYIVSSCNAPQTRLGTIGADLTRDGTATFTDSTDGKSFTVNGLVVKMGTKVPKQYTNGGTQNMRVVAQWFQARNSGNGEWGGTIIDDCLVTA